MSVWAAPPLLMGIVNVTPDSFFDKGQYLDQTAAIAHGFDLVAEGADLLDVGAESTRPGFEPVADQVQIDRLGVVLHGLREAGVPLSVDTRSAVVAAVAIAAGATVINDVSGGRQDSAMLPVVAQAGVDYVCGLWRRPPDARPRHLMLWTRIKDELLWARDACLDAGVAPEHLILDPGLGFAASLSDDWNTLAHVSDVVELGHRVLIGASHKRFLGDGTPSSDAAALAATAWCAQRGVWALRCHTIADHRQVAAVCWRLRGLEVGDAAQ